MHSDISLVNLIRSILPGLADRLDAGSITISELAPGERFALWTVARTRMQDLPEDLIQATTTFAEFAELWTLYSSQGRVRLAPVEVQSGLRVRLDPLAERDVPRLYETSLDPDSSHRWRFRGRTPSPELFTRALHDGVLCQYAVRPAHSAMLLGLVSAYGADLNAGHAYFAFQRTKNQGDGFEGALHEAAALFFSFLFDHFDLRKIYIELPSFNAPMLGSLVGSLFKVEGVLTEHYYFAGERWDQMICALSRDNWIEFAKWLGTPPVGTRATKLPEGSKPANLA